jgi:glucosamine 6-phosphate synthetase-like amidotransferase/phosphosugar isomerase protein
MQEVDFLQMQESESRRAIRGCFEKRRAARQRRGGNRPTAEEKTLGNVEEVMARGGRVVMISDAAGVAPLEGRLAYGIAVPRCDPFVAPLLCAIPIQLLAYHAAIGKGTGVDQRHNLAKSVTVEWRAAK